MPAYDGKYPTAYPDVNAVLDMLLHGVRGVLGGSLVGMYLYGSLALGDFDPASSDIDFLVVTDGPLPPATVAGLSAMHARIAASGSPWAQRLEGSYFPAAAIRRHDPANATHPSIGVDWGFGLHPHRVDWNVQRYSVREHGAILFGPLPETLIDPIDADVLRATMIENTGFWAGQLDGPDPEWLRSREYQAFAILTMCRILYTLAHGEVITKPVAAVWAQRELGEPWRELIGRALVWRGDHIPDDMTATLAFIRYVLARCRRWCGDT